MIRVTYVCNGGYAENDFCAERTARAIIREGKDVKINTENVIYWLRALVKLKEIKHTDICFVFDGEEIFVNEYGMFIGMIPIGFCDCVDRALNILDKGRYAACPHSFVMHTGGEAWCVECGKDMKEEYKFGNRKSEDKN